MPDNTFESVPVEDVLVRYNNRKIYDTTTSTYTSLGALWPLVIQGRAFSVLQKRTDEDISKDFYARMIVHALTYEGNTFTSADAWQLVQLLAQKERDQDV